MLVVLLAFIVIHEGLHAVIAALFNELEAFQVHPYGFEDIYKTPVAVRTGISGAS
ncbi:MAG TPA: hypothetical protein GX697_01490 [Firmicutes bacterium]|nr:hypothetical protein [Bacillota bacterium]